MQIFTPTKLRPPPKAAQILCKVPNKIYPGLFLFFKIIEKNVYRF